MTTPDVQMNFAVTNILRIKGYSQADIDVAIAARKAVDKFERGQLDRVTAQKRLDEAIAKPWFDLIYMDKTLQDPDRSGWAREMRLDPLKTLDSLKAPALIIFGSADPWIPVQLSTDALRASAKDHPNVTTAVVAGADHRMMRSAALLAQIEPTTLSEGAPDAPEYFGLIASWLTRQGLTRTGGL
jgi:pimeloyl-ACP methyl ester carboxylesterase